MSKFLSIMMASFFTALLVYPVLAQNREVVGATQATASGGAGMQVLHNLCRAEFPNSRMCSTADIMGIGFSEGVDLPFNSWVHPSMSLPIEHPFGDSYMDQTSGFTTVQSAVLTLSCFGWTLSVGQSVRGMVIQSAGTFGVQLCDVPTPVACCSPTGKKKKLD